VFLKSSRKQKAKEHFKPSTLIAGSNYSDIEKREGKTIMGKTIAKSSL